MTYWLAWLLTSAISQLGSDRLKAHTLVITKTTVLLVIIKSRVSSITSRCSKNEPLFREGRIPDSREQWNSSLELLRLTTQYFRRILLWINILKRHDVLLVEITPFTSFPKLFPLRKLSKQSSLNATSAVSIYKYIEEASEQFEISDHQRNPSQAHNRIQTTITSFQLSLNFLLFFIPFSQWH